MQLNQPLSNETSENVSAKQKGEDGSEGHADGWSQTAYQKTLYINWMGWIPSYTQGHCIFWRMPILHQLSNIQWEVKRQLKRYILRGHSIWNSWDQLKTTGWLSLSLPSQGYKRAIIWTISNWLLLTRESIPQQSWLVFWFSFYSILICLGLFVIQITKLWWILNWRQSSNSFHLSLWTECSHRL